MAPGEILNHKYIVGTAIDSGGFGIIYRAWDAQMEQVVAIKEYFPNGVVSRVPGQNDVIVYSGKNREVFRKGVDLLGGSPEYGRVFPARYRCPV